MSDEAKAPEVDVVDAAEPPAAESSVVSPGGEGKSVEGDISATDKTASPTETTPVDTEMVDVDDTTKTSDLADEIAPATAAEAAETNGAPASAQTGIANGNRRKSTGNADSKGKKNTPKKGKAAPSLRLDVKPGDMFFVTMRGYQPWPVIVADDEMLPETLLKKRPVSAVRIDGTYREDFLPGGKSAKDRRYPVMFLGTNEFAWEVNTNLHEFDLESVQKDVEDGKQGKKPKALWEAYQIAAENHDLDYYKTMIKDFEAAVAEEAVARAAAEEAKAEKKAKSAKRKSAVLDEGDDAELGGADADGPSPPKKAKATKKRKKGEESDGEPEKAVKTPKTKLKLNNKAPKDGSAAKSKKETKVKKSKSESEDEQPKSEEKQLTESELREKQEKTVLYLRHRMQKGFLTRDQAPQEAEMENMNDYFRQLEDIVNLEAEIIRKTKIHKVLRAIIKLESIPKEEEFSFKARSKTLLDAWSGTLATPSTTEPATNGVTEDAKKERVTTPSEAAEKNDSVQKSAEAKDDGDVAMTDADTAVKETIEIPTEKAEAGATTELVPEVVAS